MARHPTLLTPCLNADGPAPAGSTSAPVLGAGQGISIAFASPRYITLATPPIPETHSCSAIPPALLTTPGTSGQTGSPS
jgi:hypothetical protein